MLLFIHNTLPEFRVCFFNGLSNSYKTRFLITHPQLASDIYGTDGINNNKLNIRFLNGRILERLKIIKSEIVNPDIKKIILPPADSITEIIEGFWGLYIANKNCKDIYTWTEKWEAPKKEQSFKKKVKNKIHKCIFKLYTKSAKKVLVFGSKAKEYMLNIGVPENKIRITFMTSIPPKPSQSINLREIYNIPHNKKIVFNLARMIPRKGLDVLVEAISILEKKHDDFVLLVGGDGPIKSEIEKKIEGLGIKNIILIGSVETELRTPYYQQADLFVLPSKYYKGMIDGWGLPINEAIYCLTPVVATNCEGSAFDILDGMNGVMVEQNNATALAEGIENMLYCRDKKLVTQACMAANQKFSLEKMVKSFVDAVTE